MLPIQLTSFIGRAEEIAEIGQLLQTARLVTLTGPGGVGKTRLALRAAESSSGDFADGVWFVELASLADDSLVPQTVADKFGVHEIPSEPVAATLERALRERHLLLVLDNCEHVLDSCARLVEALLRGCPRVNALATSRETLHIPGEMVWPVQPLSLPEKDAPDQSDAARLFVERAQAARPTFQPHAANAAAVAEICRRLDGMPLAIELAAARVKVLSAEQIAEFLADRFALLRSGARTAPARHRTLGAAIEWSYKLLAPSERTLFDQLSVFAGGWTLDAAAVISRNTSTDQKQLTMLDSLTRLVDASLVTVDERYGAVRYRQLETLRAFGAQNLAEGQMADEVRSRHARYYLELAEALAPQGDGVEHLDWMRQVESEYDNVRSALNCLAAGDVQRALRLAVATERYWYLRGFVSEGCTWLEDLLAKVSERGVVWGRGALALADLLTLRHDDAGAGHYAEMSIDIMRAAGDLAGTARAATFLGMRALHMDDFGRARTLCCTALALARQASDGRATVKALDNLGLIAIAEHDLPEARRRFEEGLALARSIGYWFGDVSGVARLGVIARLGGDYPRARTLIEEGIAISKRFGHRPALASHITSLGNLARCEGDYAEARRLLLESVDLGQGEFGLPLVLVNAVASLGALSVAEHAYALGVQLLSAVSAAGSPHGSVQVPELRHDTEAALASARRALGASAYATAWSEGQTWSLDEAVRQASSAPSPPPAGAARTTSGIANILTPRQREVAALVALGRTNRQIGEELVITEGTARLHVEHILARLDLHTRAQLAGWAVARGLVTPPA